MVKSEVVSEGFIPEASSEKRQSRPSISIHTGASGNTDETGG